MRPFIARWWILGMLPVGFMIGWVGTRSGVPTWAILTGTIVAVVAGMGIDHWRRLRWQRRATRELAEMPGDLVGPEDMAMIRARMAERARQRRAGE
jgi:hypothetical protein